MRHEQIYSCPGCHRVYAFEESARFCQSVHLAEAGAPSGPAVAAQRGAPPSPGPEAAPVPEGMKRAPCLVCGAAWLVGLHEPAPVTCVYCNPPTINLIEESAMSTENPGATKCAKCGVSYTGGHKCDAGKLRYSLIPTGPMQEVARVYTMGAAKYSDGNWRKGMIWSRLKDALERHLNAWWSGERNDPVDGQHHLSSVVFCALSLMEFEVTHPELDDRPTSVSWNGALSNVRAKEDVK